MASARLIIAGTGSGVGKTSLSLALVRALSRRGLRVQPFKVGPDFLDPTYLTVASGRTCYNLDGWMCGRDYALDLFRRKTADADLAVIEGVMGLFDGASPDTSEGSTAEIARWLDAPVVLAAGVHGVARSLAATVKGFAAFEPDLKLAGVIANHCGSDRHAAWLNAALASASLPPLLGAIPRGAFPELPSRHLGLVTADRGNLSPAVLDALADALERHAKVEEILQLARSAPELSGLTKIADSVSRPTAADGQRPTPNIQRSTSSVQRGTAQTDSTTDRCGQVFIGVAQDEAFHFYYPDNLESLQAQGARLVFFSPLSDHRLPDSLDAVYLGGGYPEEHAAALSRNAEMRADIRRFAESGGAIYAECGGLMYLSQSIETVGGETQPMAGLLPFRTRMCARRQSLGYAEVSFAGNPMWGPAGTVLRGHEFHYSEIVEPVAEKDGWTPAYQVRYRRQSEPAAGLPAILSAVALPRPPKPPGEGGAKVEAPGVPAIAPGATAGATAGGFQRDRILAGYVHLHFAARPDAVRAFIDFARRRSACFLTRSMSNHETHGTHEMEHEKL